MAYVTRVGEIRNALPILAKRREGRTYLPFEWPTRRWENNIKVNLKEIGCEVAGWIQLAQSKIPRRVL